METEAAHPRDTAAKRRHVAATFAGAKRCSSVADVQAAVNAARQERTRHVVRCGGNLAASTHAAFDPGTHTGLVLDGELAAVSVRTIHVNGNKTFHVGAGCLIGHDPTNPISKPESSLMACVAAAECALPVVGGSSIMALGGYISTGSDGGSIRHALADCIQSIDLVDGHGELRTLHRGTEAFDAAGVSMGLFGVITGYTLELGPSYRLQGSEHKRRRSDSMLADAGAFRRANASHDNVHAYWFPNQGVDVVQEYVADRVDAEQARIPYVHEVRGAIKNWGYRTVMKAVNHAIRHGHHGVAAHLLGLFARSKRYARNFCDNWQIAGPNDDQVGIETRRGFESTEIWFDIAQADRVLAACRALFDADPIACGHSGLQIFCAARSPFWLSPAYGSDQIRVDTLWWPDCRHGSAHDYFTRFWDALLSIPTARLHWGKDLPPVGPAFGPQTLANAYPRLNDWLALRAEFDPQQIFVSDFWRGVFGIAGVAP